MATLGPPSLWSQEAHGSDVYQQSLSAGGREEKMVALPSDRRGRGKLDRGVGLDLLASQQKITSPSLPPPPSTLPQVLHPLQVTLQPGDALVWFPGWEHETRILSGPSISLSLHFMSPSNSSYQNTFSDILSERVSAHCKWRDTSHSHT